MFSLSYRYERECWPWSTAETDWRGPWRRAGHTTGTTLRTVLYILVWFRYLVMLRRGLLCISRSGFLTEEPMYPYKTFLIMPLYLFWDHDINNIATSALLRQVRTCSACSLSWCVASQLWTWRCRYHIKSKLKRLCWKSAPAVSAPELAQPHDFR